MGFTTYKMFVIIAIIAVFAFCITQEGVDEKKIEEVRVSYQPSWHHVALFVIVEKGWDERILGTKLKTTRFPSGPPQMEVFAAGEHEIAYIGAAPPLSLLSKGFDAKIVAVANTEGSSLVAKSDIEYTGPKSLEGKKIMTHPPGSIQHTVLIKWLSENEVDLSKVKIIVPPGGVEEIREALRAGAIDFGFLPEPSGYVMEFEGYGKIVLNSSEMLPNHPCCVVLMRGDFMREKSEIAVKFLALHIIASEYAKDPKNKEEVKKIIMKWLNVEEKVASIFPGRTNLQTDPRIKDWLEGVDLLCEAQYQSKITKDVSGNPVRITPEEVVDPRLYEEAIKLVPKIKSDLGLK